MAQRIDKDTRDRLVNIVLDHGGTPRHRLFEYPYRDDDSRALIEAANSTVTKMLAALNDQPN